MFSKITSRQLPPDPAGAIVQRRVSQQTKLITNQVGVHGIAAGLARQGALFLRAFETPREVARSCWWSVGFPLRFQVKNGSRVGRSRIAQQAHVRCFAMADEDDAPHVGRHVPYLYVSPWIRQAVSLHPDRADAAERICESHRVHPCVLMKLSR